MLKDRGDSLEGKVATVSGAGNVAIYCCEKLYQKGAKPVTVSDSRGSVYDPDGIKVDVLKQVKEVERASLTRYVELVPTAKYVPVSEYPRGQALRMKLFHVTQLSHAQPRPVSPEDAKTLLANGCKWCC